MTDVLTQLRHACLPPAVTSVPDEGAARILEAWFARPDGGLSPLLALHRLNPHVEAHWSIAWPEWPPGLWPKIVAAGQKITRRLLRWYINPIVEQQNAINAASLQALEALAEEVAILQGQQMEGQGPTQEMG